MPAVGAEMTTVNLERAAVSEARTRVAFLTPAELPDCSPQQLKVRVTKQPTNGKLEVEEGNGFGYQKESSRAKCGEKPVWGMLLYYKSNANFKGSDTAVVESFTEAGVARRYRFKITVK
jgi:hypothetical protein